MTPDAVECRLSKAFPREASSWRQATEEVRDLCRRARVLAGVNEDDALDFGQLETPAEWNAQGVAATVRFYKLMPETKKEEFCLEFAHWLGLPGAED
jgi:hypothetical protein